MADGSWRHRHGAVALFSAAVVLLVALGVWWFVFLYQAIDTEHALQLRLVALDARLGDPAALQVQYDRKRGMVLGEGGLLLSLLLAVVAMLYRLVRSERRFRTEMQDFLSRVTHEMKTPLAGIKAVLQTIQSGRMPPEQLAEVVALALREAEREEHLIQNLLLAQRMRMPDQSLARDQVDLGELLERFAQHRRAMAGESAQYALAVGKDLLIRGDAAAVWTILENLADNAVKYGGRQLRIAAERDGSQVRVQVADNGQGFDQAGSEALFLPFRRGTVAGHGTGLGLHLSRTLAERMGGKLAAESAGPGRGAMFTLRLPTS